MRALEKDTGLRESIRRGIEADVLLSFPDGVVRRGMTQKVEWDRIQRVLEKWVRGFYWKEYGERLPAQAAFEVAMLRPELCGQFAGQVRPSHGSWPRTFEYWHARDVLDPTRSMWSFLVWDEMGFVAVTNQPLDVVRLDLTE